MKFFTDKKLEEYVDKKLSEMAEKAVISKVDQIVEQVACQIVGEKAFRRLQTNKDLWEVGRFGSPYDASKFYNLMHDASGKMLEAHFFDNGKKILREEIKSPEVIKVLVKAINEYQVKSK